MVSILEAARRIADGPCPTYWDWELVGTVGRFGPDGGCVLKCAHCRRKLHQHRQDCPWRLRHEIVAAVERGVRTRDDRRAEHERRQRLRGRYGTMDDMEPGSVAFASEDG